MDVQVVCESVCRQGCCQSGAGCMDWSIDLNGGQLAKVWLANADLRGAALNGANLRGGFLMHADLSDADLRDADLQHANLVSANLTNANLTNANLTNANLTNANLTGADTRWANFTGADLTGTQQNEETVPVPNDTVDLRGGLLAGAYLAREDLRGAQLAGSDLRGAQLTDANLSGANLCGANLCGADLTGADLTGADLTGADLTAAKLTRTDFRRAKISGADFRGARLTEALSSTLNLLATIKAQDQLSETSDDPSVDVQSGDPDLLLQADGPEDRRFLASQLRRISLMLNLGRNSKGWWSGRAENQPAPKYFIGDVGPGGGTVFFDAGIPREWGQYLEAAPVTWYDGGEDPLLMWYPFEISSLHANWHSFVGSGKANTKAIARGQRKLDAHSDTAALACVAYRGGGFKDWYLPSIGELFEMYDSRCVFRSLKTGKYWSSSEGHYADPESILLLIFTDQERGGGDAYPESHYAVRPIRAF